MARSDWVKLREYAGQLEAALDLGILEGAGIPTLVRGPEIGIFGPGFVGATSRGVSILVPRDRLEAALELLDGDEGAEAG
ncbi:MAG: DUF2007 domain-containing protein [Gemmatimonadetes bacterium]|nr:DUF2007 domain-containing protein [Gemmatimonadota bacterium]